MQISDVFGLPVGAFVLFSTPDAPPLTLGCDGSEISRVDFHALFQVIGTRYGAGDGSTTFNIPDFRGFVPRGWDNGAGVDPDASSRYALYSGGVTGDEVGSYQDDAFQGHWHELVTMLGGFANWNAHGFGNYSSFNGIADRTSSAYGAHNPKSDGVNGTPRVSSETRTKNLATYFCIRF